VSASLDLAPRADFPALADNALAYLDNAATTQKPARVIEALADFYRRGCANVGRGVYEWAERSSAAYEQARARVAAFVGAAAAEQLVFTSGATEALNLVARGWAHARLGPGARILTTPLEHHANFLPWQALARETGARLELVAIDDAGELDLDDAAAKLPGATLLAVTAMSNVLGTCPPLPELARLARAQGVCMVVDATQALAHARFSLHEVDCDFAVLSGHKLLGPMGIGALVGTPERLAELQPQRLGGGMVREVELGGARWREPPWGLEGGTPNVAAAVALAEALDYLDGLGRARIIAHEHALLDSLLTRLAAWPEVRVIGRPAAGVVSLCLADHHAHDVATLLDEVGVAVRAGQHCAQPLLRRLDLSATLRISFAPYNDARDLESLLAGLERAARLLG
jgi:cysteine desulfurase/selenocysteine lyase